MADTQRTGHVWKGDKSAPCARQFPNRSTSLPRHRSTSPFAFDAYAPPPVTFPAGDGAGARRQEASRSRPVAYNPPPAFKGLRTLFTNNTYNLRREPPVADSELFSDASRKKEHEAASQDTPIRKASQALLSGIGQILTSDTLRRTASTILTSAARIGSQIVTKGMEVATHILQDMDYEDAEQLPVTEEQVTCRGFHVKVHGDDLLLQAVHFEKAELQVRVQLGSKLTSYTPFPPFCDHDNNLSLKFDAGNVIEVLTPSGTSIADINWDTSESGILTLHLLQ